MSIPELTFSFFGPVLDDAAADGNPDDASTGTGATTLPDREREAVAALREVVFCGEQGYDEDEAWCMEDLDCHHMVVSMPGAGEDTTGMPFPLVAYARMRPCGWISHVCVSKEFRNKGIGRRVVEAITAHGQEKLKLRPTLMALAKLVDWYRELGFEVDGPSTTGGGHEIVPMVTAARS